MRRSRAVSILPLAGLILGGSVGVASAAGQDFRLVNRTGYQIDEVYVGPHSSANWGRDLMGEKSLADGIGLNVTFPHSTTNCNFDIKVKYNDGEEAEWSEVDLCKWSTISLFWTNGATRAVGE